MLLIIFLALMANSALVSGQCNLGSSPLTNFDWDKFADGKPWHILLHVPNDFEDNLACNTVTFEPQDCNVSLTYNFAYDIKAQKNVKYPAFVRNWNTNGYMESIHTPSIWTGTFLNLAVDYDSYFITRHCPYFSSEPTLYVAFRSRHPGILTWLRVLKKLLENKIDIRQFVKWGTKNCLTTVSSTV